MKLLYLNGVDRTRDASTTEQLLRADSSVELTTVSSPPDAFDRLRTHGNVDVLVTSPAVARSETLALIVSLRRDKVPVAILPVVTESQQEFATAAIAAGADDVLLQLGGTLLNPTETLSRIVVAPTRPKSAGRPLRVLYAGPDDLVWSLLGQVPFVLATRAHLDAAAERPLVAPEAPDGDFECDLVLIDALPDSGLQARAVKSMLADASERPVLVLTPPNQPADPESLGLRSENVIPKTGLYRRPLVAALERANAGLARTPVSQNGAGPAAFTPDAADAQGGESVAAPAEARPPAAAVDTGWKQERAELEQRLTEARAALAEAEKNQSQAAGEAQQVRDHLDAALEAARAELTEAANLQRQEREARESFEASAERLEGQVKSLEEAHRVERARWEEKTDSLEGRLRSAAAAAARAEFEATVEAGKAELRHQGWCISAEAIRSGLAHAELPGRVEIVPGDPMLVLDTAHNPASARALVQALAELPAPRRRTLIVSISHDKDVPAIVHELAPYFHRFVVTQYQDNPRAVPAVKLAEMFRGELVGRNAEVIVCDTPLDAWQAATQSAVPGEYICIAGSFFLAAEMRPFVLQHYAAETSEPIAR
jgi:hypothetical protein